MAAKEDLAGTLPSALRSMALNTSISGAGGSTLLLSVMARTGHRKVGLFDPRYGSGRWDVAGQTSMTSLCG